MRYTVSMTIEEMAHRSLAKLEQVFQVIPETTMKSLTKEILKAKQICLYGCGRE